MRARFASNRHEQHKAAFFELLSHQWLKEHGFDVECLDNDTTQGKTPDFLVSKNGTSLFYLEWCIATESDAEAADEKNKILSKNG